MVRSGYVWLIYNFYADGWWKQNNEDIECTVEEMEEAMISSTILTLANSFFDTSGKPTVSGWVRYGLIIMRMVKKK